ncbi:MAG: SRPBCC family protein [Actinobacteria bacterium]|nr:SRPBCC family protein [Actinomycetota bacterium]
MKVEGARNFDAPREVVWEVLNDPSRMAKTMPGVESFDIRDERHWTANVKVPLGIGGLKLSIDFEKTEEREPEYAELQAKGKGVGAMLNMRTRFTLAEEGATTAMQWEADVRIGGTVGSMGQRVVQPIVNQQVASVLDALDEQVMQAKGQRSPQAVATGGGAASAPDVYLGAVPSDKDLFAEDADTGAGDTGDSVAPSTGTVAVPPPSTEAPATTEPEVYIGAEPGVRPPAPVEWTPDEG